MIKTPAFWNDRGLVSDLLLPLSWLYSAGVALRRNLAEPEMLPVPVICVGNLTVGGAGKTPVALHIGTILKNKNIGGFFLSRGYGGRFNGPLLVDAQRHMAKEVGDEPLLLAQVLPTVVAKDRLAGVRFALDQGARIIVLDDGFQNFSVAKTLSLVVIDAAIGFGNGRLLPAGPLREPVKAGLQRADVAIVINGNMPLPVEVPVLHAGTRLTGNWRGKKVLAFCGLAYPDKFFKALEAAGAEVTDTIAFPDHYPYMQGDIEKLVGRAGVRGAIPVTTAKDAARLSPGLKAQVTVAEMTLAFDHPERLDALIAEAVAS